MRILRTVLLTAALAVLTRAQMYDASSNLDLPREGMGGMGGCTKGWEWQCKSGDCLPKYDVCNGIAQCPDGSDEWDCDGVKHQREEKAKATTLPPTTTAAPSGYVSLTRAQFTFLAFMTVALLACLFCFVRRRARARALNRNRRGNISQSMFTQDSEDEDDILISSMYSTSNAT